MIGTSSPLAAHIGGTSSRAGVRSPQGRVSSRTSTMTAASISTVRALAKSIGARWPSSGLPSGMPR